MSIFKYANNGWHITAVKVEYKRKQLPGMYALSPLSNGYAYMPPIKFLQLEVQKP